MTTTRRHDALPEGHKLLWYVLDAVLGQGGFGITYLGRDTNLDQAVAIKEFLPTEFATRSQDSRVHPLSEDDTGPFEWGMSRFISEARTLAQFKHRNIVQVFTVFEENNTAYMVMEYERGRSLADALKFGHVKGEEALRDMLDQILDGLQIIHDAGFIHRDIKPDNIYLRDDGSPVLLDFGSARQALGGGTRTLTALVSPRYAPFEQYDDSSEGETRQGPWSDIYGLGATLYYAVTGKGPPDALARASAVMSGSDPYVPAIEAGAGRYSPSLLIAVDAALEFHPHNRPQSIAAWRELLAGDFQDAPTRITRSEAQPAPATIAVDTRPITSRTAGASGLAGTGADTRWDVLPGGSTSRVEGSDEAPVSPPRTRRGLVVVGVAALVLALAGGWLATREEAPLPDAAPSIPAPPLADAESETAAPGPDGPDAAVAQRLADGRRALEAMRLTSPPGDNAAEHFRGVLELEPDNVEATRGLRGIVESYIDIAQRAVDRDDQEMAREYLDKAAAVLPGSEIVELARRRVESGDAVAPLAAMPTPTFKTSLAPAAPASGSLFRDCESCPEMVAIEPGSFVMGREPGPDVLAQEAPARRVELASRFAIGRDEVTFAQWDACVAAGGCSHAPDDGGWGRGDRPVIDVSWEHAREYVEWLSSETGHAYRLPSEAEWEYVAGGARADAFPWGDTPRADAANCWDCERTGARERTAPVGTFAANPLGVRDLAGNVWEWVEDCWHPSHEGAPTDGSARTTGNCRLRVLKGGSWMNESPSLRVTNRTKQATGFRRNFVGLRVARGL